MAIDVSGVYDTHGCAICEAIVARPEDESPLLIWELEELHIGHDLILKWQQYWKGDAGWNRKRLIQTAQREATERKKVAKKRGSLK